MDIANLKAFVSIANTGSFSLASEELFLTQPAISKRISCLELELDTPLFDRIGRKVRLTAAGETLYKHAQLILKEVNNAKKSVANLSESVEGELKIATSHHIGLHRLPSVLTHYVSNYPKVDLAIDFMDSEDACKLIEQGEIELAIVTLPLTPITNLHQKLIWNDPLSFVVNKTHELCNSSVTLQRLTEHAAVLPSHGTFTREVIQELFAEHKLELNIRMSTNYLETIKMLIQVGLGWGVIPNSMIDKDLVVLKVPKIKIARQLGIVWHAKHSLSNPAQALMDYLISNMKS